PGAGRPPWANRVRHTLDRARAGRRARQHGCRRARRAAREGAGRRRCAARGVAMNEPAARLRDAVRTIQALRERLAALQAERSPPIAVVGMSCRFAGAENPRALWQMLASGRDAIRPTPADRWDNAEWFSPDPDAPGRIAFCD